MGASCVVTPKVLVTNANGKTEEKESQLFKNLYTMTGDREATKTLYGFSKTEEALKLEGIEHDSMGEVTATSLIDILKLNDTVDAMKQEQVIKEDLGLMEKGKPKVMSVFAAVDKMNKFNGTNKNYVVTPVKTEGGYTLQVVPNTGENMKRAREISFNREYNNQILNILRDLGFDIDILDSEDFDGIFDPTTARFSDGFITAILIAKGEKGEDALPEEFSHLMIEGLKRNKLVERLLDTITEDTIDEVLGEQAEEYRERYKNDPAKLKKEVAGKMLADRIKNGPRATTVQSKGSLLSRAWNFAKGLFSKVTDEQVKSARSKAEDIVDKIYEGIKDRTLIKLFDIKDLMDGEALYKIKEKLDNLKNMSYRALQITAKRMNIERIRLSKVRYGKEDKSTLEALETAHKEGRYIDSVSGFIQDALKEAEDILKAWNKLGSIEELKGSSDLAVLSNVAKVLRRMEEFFDGYKDVLSEYTRLSDEEIQKRLEDPEDTSHGINPVIARKLADSALSALRIIQLMQENFLKTQYNVVYAYMRTIFGEDKVVKLSQDKTDAKSEIMTLEAILDHAARDLNVMDRYFSSLSDMDDPMLTFVKAGVDKKKYERDLEIIQYAGEIRLWEKKLKAAGYTSDFMYLKDADGVPTGYLLSPYDFEGGRQALEEYKQSLKDRGLPASRIAKKVREWKELERVEVTVNGEVRSEPRYLRIYYDEKYQRIWDTTKDEEKIPSHKRYTLVPNPAVFSKNANKINSLPKVLREYYEYMMDLKKKMMDKIPTGGYSLFKAIYISKTGLDGIISRSGGNPSNMVRAVLQNLKNNFVRRADEIDTDRIKDNQEEIIDDLILDKVLKPMLGKDKIEEIKEEFTKLFTTETNTDKLELILQEKFKEFGMRKAQISAAIRAIMGIIDEYMDNNFEVQKDFADNTIQKLPTNYMRKLKNMRDMSTDFSGAMLAFMGMAINYDKLNEIIDLLEVTRSFIKKRDVKVVENGKVVSYTWKAINNSYREEVSLTGAETNIGKVLDTYFESAIYGHRKKREVFNVAGKNIDVGKIADALKNYSGLLGLGLNIFCALSNVLVGKMLLWIETGAREYFNLKEYCWAEAEYAKLMFKYIGELSSPVKQSKLGLLIQRYDIMTENFGNMTRSKHYESALKNIIGNNELLYVGMLAGEHNLRCTSTLAMMKHTKLREGGKDGKEICLYDAFETVEVNGVKKLQLKSNLFIEKEVRDEKGYVVIEKDEKGKKKIKKEWVAYDEAMDYKMKLKMKSVNDNLNGAFNEDDRGTIHRNAIGRLIMQFRQWMPKHYYRRFRRAEWDQDLEARVEGYYNTLGKFTLNLFKDIKRGKFALLENYRLLDSHELANIRRCITEVTLFGVLFVLCKLGSGLKLKDYDWVEKMVMYQLLRLKLEAGASMPFNLDFPKNIVKIMNSPAASISQLNNILKILDFSSYLDELQSGPYKGHSRGFKAWVSATPGAARIWQAVAFDLGMFSYFGK